MSLLASKREMGAIASDSRTVWAFRKFERKELMLIALWK